MAARRSNEEHMISQVLLFFVLLSQLTTNRWTLKLRFPGLRRRSREWNLEFNDSKIPNSLQPHHQT